MAESVARKVLKEGMKSWIVTAERIQAGLAQLREELDDVLAEARHEYEHRAEGAADRHPEPAPDAEAKATKPKASRSSNTRPSPRRGANTTTVAV